MVPGHIAGTVNKQQLLATSLTWLVASEGVVPAEVSGPRRHTSSPLASGKEELRLTLTQRGK